MHLQGGYLISVLLSVREVDWADKEVKDFSANCCHCHMDR